MNQSLHFQLPDTRSYPSDPIKNDLLLHAQHIASSSSKAQIALSQEMLRTQITEMLQQNHYLGLSVALSMASHTEVYRVLWQELDQTLHAQHEQEYQWIALPVVAVIGCNHNTTLNAQVPVQEITQTLQPLYPNIDLSLIHWLPELLTANDLSHIKAHQWYQAKTIEGVNTLCSKIQPQPLTITSGQSVQVYYAVAYAPYALHLPLNRNLDQTALPLMQVWQSSLSQSGVTLFANPLPLQSPMSAIYSGSQMRLRMALDVFAGNAIRAVRLQSPRVGVVIASQENGQLLFGFNAADSAFELVSQVFSWPLSPMDNIDVIIQNFIDLLTECQVENVRLLHNPLSARDELPSYAQALGLPGYNPLFIESH